MHSSQILLLLSAMLKFEDYSVTPMLDDLSARAEAAGELSVEARTV